MHRVQSILSLLVVLLIGAGCGLGPAPSADEALLGATQLTKPSGEESGEFFVLPDGLWVQRAGEESDTSFELGEVVGLLPAEGAGPARPRHLFVVVEQHSWGHLMQRLDSRPVARRIPGDKAELVTLRPGQSVNAIADLCVVEGAPSQNDCLTDAAPGRRWRLYPYSDPNRLDLAEEASGLPARPAVVAFRGVRTDEIRTMVLAADGADGRWLAVPLPQRRPLPARPIAIADASCPLERGALAEYGVELLRGEVEMPTHPLPMENEAYRHGVDALLDCTKKGARVGAPSLFRPFITLADDTIAGPPALTRQPLAVGKMEPAARAMMLAAHAYLAVGETVVADFLITGALSSDRSRNREPIALRSLQLAAAAGRPETALQRGRSASRGDWNRQNNPDYLLGKAAALAAMGLDNAFFDQRRRARESAQRLDEKELLYWMSWAGYAAEMEGAGRPDGGLDSRVDKEAEAGRTLWAVAYAWLARRYETDAPTRPSKPRAEKLGIAELDAGLRGEGFDLACPSEATCPLDVYGRRLQAKLDRLSGGSALRQTLEALGGSAIRPGFSWQRLESRAKTPVERFSLLVEVARKLPESRDGRLAEQTAGVIADLIEEAGLCDYHDPDDELAVAARLIEMERAGRPRPSDGLSLLDWFAGTVNRTCEAVGAADSLVERSTKLMKPATLLPDIFSALLDRAESTDDRRAVVERAAAYAREHNLGKACKRWHLSLAAAYAKSGRYRPAEKELNGAVNCGVSAEYGRTESLLIAYVAFLKSARLPRRLDEPLLQVAEAMTRRRFEPEVCTGLASFDFEPFAPLDPDIVQLAETLSTSRPDRTGELTVRSSLDQLDDLKEAMGRAVGQLADGAFETARDSLADARAIAERLGHAPALSQIDFLARALYGVPAGDLDGWEPPEACRPSDAAPTSSLPAEPTRLRCRLKQSEVDALLDAPTSGADEPESMTTRGVLLLLANRPDDLRRHVERESAPEPLRRLCTNERERSWEGETVVDEPSATEK